MVMNNPDSMYQHSTERQRELIEERNQARAAEAVRRQHSYSGRLATYLRMAADAIDPAGRMRNPRA
jgi:hypothetical protein